MTNHSPWPLFSEDLAFAQHWLLDQWCRWEPLPRQLAHWGLGLGLVQETAALCQAGDGRLDEGTQRQLCFRLARLQQSCHAYRELIGPEALQLKTLRLRTSQDPIKIGLIGGLGDHLQLLSLLSSCDPRLLPKLLLEASPIRIKQLERCLVSLPWLQLRPWSQPLQNYPYLQIDLSAVLWQLGIRCHSPWLKPLAAHGTPRNLLCCWRAAGQADAFSAWSRSVPFALVLNFYTELLKSSRWAGRRIIDISQWNPWEQRLLGSMGIQLHDPASSDLWDLAQLTAQCQVVSIDTALAHLCAAMGHPALMLLPLYADERWQELMQSGQSYAEILQPLRQVRFGCWTQPLAQVGAAIRP